MIKGKGAEFHVLGRGVTCHLEFSREEGSLVRL